MRTVGESMLIYDLRHYKDYQRSLKTIPERIAMINMKLTSVKGINTDKIPVQGGGSANGDAWTNGIYDKMRLEQSYKSTKYVLSILDRALSALSDRERELIENMYIENIPHAVELFGNSHGYEKSQCYNIRNAALEKMDRSCSGVMA